MKIRNLSFCLTTVLLCTHIYANDIVNLEKVKVTTASLGEEKNIEDV